MSKQRLEQKQYQKLSPQQIQFLGLLQIPIVSLEKRIEEELEDNPALEEDEENDTYFSSNKTDFSDFQIEDKSESLTSYLEKQLVGIELSKGNLFLVKYLINSLDSNGFLSRDLFSISSDLLISDNLDISEVKMLNALNVLQNLEPIGVGANSLQECLLIQLKKLYPENKLAFKIITEFYSQFSNKNFENIIKNLGISEEKLKSTYSLIESLNPIPSNGFFKNEEISEYIFPDFTLLVVNNQLELKLNKSNTKPIKISKYYSNLLNETNDKTTKEFLQKKVEKALWFKKALIKREATLKKVMLAIISLQENYLLSGVESDLKPMKLADIANIVNMDISTISRVSNSKYVETHFRTFKLKELFSEAYKKDDGQVISTNEIKKHLKEIILTEDKTTPYNDEQLAELLGKDNYHIARRTVAKYREQLGIKIAKLRREL
ncbi:RNA polymerase factor sigma-54 [Flavobacteriales bacterium]|nr:RNA polymerase factor sigma-54 [Flavobacteriales bacterium]